MRRGTTGKYHVRDYGGDQVRAFIQAHLPPDPPLDLNGELQQLRLLVYQNCLPLPFQGYATEVRY